MTNGNEREREAILAVMRDMGSPVTYHDISQRAGPRLASSLMEMVQEGLVVRQEASGGEPATYRPSTKAASE